MAQTPFGNDPAKIEKYLCFWNREDVRRPLLIRGAFTPDELRLLMDSLASRGLFLNIMVKSIEKSRPSDR